MRSRSRSRIIYLNTSYRKAPGALPLSCPDYYDNLFRAPDIVFLFLVAAFLLFSKRLSNSVAGADDMRVYYAQRDRMKKEQVAVTVLY
jgi:hypothetical protein